MSHFYTRLSVFTLSGLLLAAGQAQADAPTKAGAECLVGAAAVTFGACMLLRRNDANNRLECLALAGALGAGGAALCYTYSKNLEKRQKELAGHENDLRSQIAYVHGLNEDTQKLNTTLTQKVSEVTTSTDQLVARIQQGNQDQQSLAKARKELDNEVKQAQLQVDSGTKALDRAKKYKESHPDPAPELDAAIAEQEKLLANAKQEVDQLAAQRARV